MPSGAKKRRALKKKKKQQEAIATTTINNKGLNGDHLHGHQDERENDSNSSSPSSYENEDFGTKESSSAMLNGISKEISKEGDVAQGQLGSQSVGEANTVEKFPISFSDNSSHTSKNVLDSVESKVAERVSEIPISSEKRHILLTGPPVIRRTSWLSCCGLFDAMSS